jgi:hypothetical protein
MKEIRMLKRLLVRFEGGVGVIPEAAGAGPVTAGVWFAAGLPRLGDD